MQALNKFAVWQITSKKSSILLLLYCVYNFLQSFIIFLCLSMYWKMNRNFSSFNFFSSCKFWQLFFFINFDQLFFFLAKFNMICFFLAKFDSYFLTSKFWSDFSLSVIICFVSCFCWIFFILYFASFILHCKSCDA